MENQWRGLTRTRTTVRVLPHDVHGTHPHPGYQPPTHRTTVYSSCPCTPLCDTTARSKMSKITKLLPTGCYRKPPSWYNRHPRTCPADWLVPGHVRLGLSERPGSHRWWYTRESSVVIQQGVNPGYSGVNPGHSGVKTVPFFRNCHF